MHSPLTAPRIEDAEPGTRVDACHELVSHVGKALDLASRHAVKQLGLGSAAGGDFQHLGSAHVEPTVNVAVWAGSQSLNSAFTTLEGACGEVAHISRVVHRHGTAVHVVGEQNIVGGPAVAPEPRRKLTVGVQILGGLGAGVVFAEYAAFASRVVDVVDLGFFTCALDCPAAPGLERVAHLPVCCVDHAGSGAFACVFAIHRGVQPTVKRFEVEDFVCPINGTIFKRNGALLAGVFGVHGDDFGPGLSHPDVEGAIVVGNAACGGLVWGDLPKEVAPFVAGCFAVVGEYAAARARIVAEARDVDLVVVVFGDVPEELPVFFDFVGFVPRLIVRRQFLHLVVLRVNIIKPCVAGRDHDVPVGKRHIPPGVDFFTGVSCGVVKHVAGYVSPGF